jgi:ribosomal protein L37AE/L43A
MERQNGKESEMRVMSFGAAPARVREESSADVDRMRCTRCGEAWGYDIVEQVAIWSCGRCGYEARERAVDHDAMLDAGQESMFS